MAQPRIALYAEPANQASSHITVELFMAGTGTKYTPLKNQDILDGKLNDYDVLIVEGAYEPNLYEKWVTQPVCDRIRESVERGMGYVGICGGAYLAMDKPCFTTSKDKKRPLIGIAHADVKEGCTYGLMDVQIDDAASPVFSGYKKGILSGRPVAKGDKFSMTYFYGPAMKPREGTDAKNVASYSISKLYGRYRDWQNEWSAIMTDKFGEGNIVLFGPHPEINFGALGNGGMLLNAISHAAGNKPEEDYKFTKLPEVLGPASELVVALDTIIFGR